MCFCTNIKGRFLASSNTVDNCFQEFDMKANLKSLNIALKERYPILFHNFCFKKFGLEKFFDQKEILVKKIIPKNYLVQRFFEKGQNVNRYS